MRTLLIFILTLFIISNWNTIKNKLAPLTKLSMNLVNDSEQIGGGQIDSPLHNNSGFTNNWLESRHNDQLFNVRYPDYQLYQHDTSTATDTNYKTILGSIQERSELNDNYFSKSNIVHLKNLIASQVYKKSGYSISAQAQSETELLIIMRAIFLQYAKHLPNDIRGQIAELNLKVLMDVVPRIITKVKMELTYQRDHGSQPLPIQLPVNVSNAGTKTGRSFDSFIV